MVTVTPMRQLPFYEAGTVFESAEPLSPEQAVVAAGLDFAVELTPVYHATSDNAMTRLSEWQGVRRADNELVMGIVKSTYQPIQNLDAFAFLNVVTESGEAIIRSGGAARGGALSWLYAQVPQTVSLDADDSEQITVGFMVSNGHDGKRALRATPILLRMATLTMLSGKALGLSFGLRHSGSAAGKVDEARQALGVTFGSLNRLQAIASTLIRNRFMRAEVDLALQALAPAADEAAVHPKVQERRDTIRAILYGSPTLAAHRNETTVNGWAFYMAVCEYADFFAPDRESFRSTAAENRLLSVTAGDAWKLKDKALRWALAR